MSCDTSQPCVVVCSLSRKSLKN